jgi:amino acid transporter
LITGSTGLIDAASTVAESTTWQFVIGLVLILLAGALMSAGWRWSARLQAILLGIAMLGLLVAGLVALFKSNDSFIAGFNEFAEPHTGNPDTYGQTIANAQEAGIETDPSFSLSNTIPLIGIFAGFSIYSYFTTYVGGELRQAQTMRTANTMALAGVVPILLVLVFGAIFLNTFGSEFMVAANAAGSLPPEITAAPTYFFLLAAGTGSSFLGWFLLVTYLVYFPLICYLAFLQPVRTMFAYSFDGILPKGAAKLSRTNAPYVTVIATMVIASAVLLWAVNSDKIFVVLVYAILAQITAMALVALSAAVVPWRRPELYRAGATTRTFAGVPVVTIAGIGGVLATGFLFYLYFHYPSFGLADKGEFFTWIGVTIGAAIVYYLAARWVRARQGVDLSLVYREIPPE